MVKLRVTLGSFYIYFHSNYPQRSRSGLSFGDSDWTARRGVGPRPRGLSVTCPAIATDSKFSSRAAAHRESTTLDSDHHIPGRR